MEQSVPCSRVGESRTENDGSSPRLISAPENLRIDSTPVNVPSRYVLLYLRLRLYFVIIHHRLRKIIYGWSDRSSDEVEMYLKICGLLTFAIGVTSVMFDPVRSLDDLSSTPKINDINEKTSTTEDHGQNETEEFLNFGRNRSEWNQRYRIRYLENPERVLQSKVNVLARLLKIHVDHLRDKTEQVELVFLVDSSASVGLENFRSELNFVRKLLSDFTVEPRATRVAVVTFAGRRHIRRHIDQISRSEASDQKCQLLNRQLGNITYTGGGTYTRGALLEALAILQNSREGSEKVVFLITDGFSNSGDPRPAAKHLKNIGATIFTFGIRTGNVEELHDIASEPGYTHSYLLDSFPEFEALARRALHRDLKAGRNVPVTVPSDCDWLCSPKNGSEETEQCCDEMATCVCGTATGHYACLCPRGYFGSGLKGFCQPCPNGTFDQRDTPIDSGNFCTPCPNTNHVTMKVPATSVDDCVCAPGFTTDGENCEAIRCPKLTVPENGYFVKASACSNVVNAACGLRCRIGFNLLGDSIRLCRKDGMWSGTEPQCLLKTCAALKGPIHGRIRCEHEENDKKIKATDLPAYPIDTRCQFKCDNGFQLRGSKVRNCLPLSRWDGLKVTCKQIKCEPLRRLANGKITPETCTGPKKLPFGTNCTFSCEDGFVLEGPKRRHCSGRSGIWSQRHSVNQCVDKTPPNVTCPTNSTWETLPGKNYAVVKWPVPTASDNSDKVPHVWTKPHISLPWKAKIGSHKIVYIAQDASGNKARCKFFVQVIDKEPPVVENCVDPPTFLSVRQTGEENVTWNEPIFYDNSERPVMMEKSHSKPECFCPLGTTQIVYRATDAFNNSASCVLNVTVEDACKDTPILSNGQANCQTIESQAVQCVVTCEEGYGFAVDQPSNFDPGDSVILTCGSNESAWNNTFFPDCSVTEIPSSVGLDGSVILQGDTDLCDNSTLLRELTDQITGDIATNMLDMCGNDIDCSFAKSDTNCEEEITEENEIDSNILGRRRRNSKFVDSPKTKNPVKARSKSRVKRKRAKIEIKFRFIGKIVEEHRNNPKMGIQKLREKIQAMTESGQLNLFHNRTNQEIAKLALNLKTVFKDAREMCELGRVLKKHNCTKCPIGTFHNTTREQCQACYFGEYQSIAGATKCNKCPPRMFTKKMHSKSVSDCQPVCRPGYFSRRKQNQVSFLGLEPCTTCDIGFYQPDYGKMYCHACPDNKTTANRGSMTADDCFSLSGDDSCEKIPCLNGGRCATENGSFSCECPEHYVGSICEKLPDPCESSPCLNEGECTTVNGKGDGILYSCNCKAGFTGNNCGTYIDECSTNPCQNGGSCVSTDKDFNCACKDGFEGDFCETALSHCDPWTCEEGSTCVTVDGTWKCLCRRGFLGLRCNLLPCDWLPCPPNAICLNVDEMNVTRNSYRCVCPDGYEGEDCAIRIDHCKDSPCINGGKCSNQLLNYTCECAITFTGVNCETELSADFVLHFSEVGTANYVAMKGPKKNLTALTVCLWLQSVDTFNYGTVLSYATKYQDNAFTLTDYNGFVLYVNGEKVVTDITVNDGYWHFLCVDWRSEEGTWSAYVDGLLRDNGTLLAKDSIVIGNGTIVIGQEQDRLGGGFSASEAFLGKLSYLDVWDRILEKEAIEDMSKSCVKYHGSTLAWSQTREHIRGNVGILEGIFCRGCPPPAAPPKGTVDVSEDGSEVEYSCEAGYSVRVGNWIGTSYVRRCMKHGEWEGYRTPVCTKVKCGFPGYFPRGRVHGRSFVYGDEIHYSCGEGYELRGNPHRHCNADGNWSGIEPICIGVTCRNLLAPENGDMEYIIEEHERDDISILQVGQQLEFKCDRGFRLSGERYLTCLESGNWDFERPSCLPSGCPPPKSMEHGYISANQSAVLTAYDKFNRTSVSETLEDTREDKTTYSFGDVVALSCDDGYKLKGNRNLLDEFRLQCSTNGTWTGLVPDCVRLRCPPPEEVVNGGIFFRLDDGTELRVPRRKNNEEQTSTNLDDEIDDTDDTEKEEIDLFRELLDEERLEYFTNKSASLFTPGAKVYTACESGYDLIGEATRICLRNETWSRNEAVCGRKRCPIDDHVVVGLLASKLKGSSSLDNDSEEMESEASTIGGLYGNVYFLFEGSYYENEVVFYCENETNLDLGSINVTEEFRNLTWRCNEDGKWTFRDAELNETNLAKLLREEVEICKGIMCGAPQIPSNGYVVNASNTTEEITSRKVNTTLTFRCRNGYDLQGSDEATCLPSGIWSSIPSCRPVSCKNPPKILNAVLEETSAEIDEYVFGNMITYECTPGYKIFGQGNARCLANGKWSRIHGKCSKISCGKPKLPPGVTVYGRSYLFQEHLTYNCPGGGPKGSITCKSDGKWSDPPACN